MRVTTSPTPPTFHRGQAASATSLGADADARTARAALLVQEALGLLDNTGASAGIGTVKAAHVPGPPDRLLRLPEVQRLTGLGRSAIYQQMKDGYFPRSVKVGPRAATWSEAAVQAWIRQRLA